MNVFRGRIVKADLKGNVSDGTTSFTCSDFAEAAQDYYLRELAFQSAVSLIANAVSKCEFKTYSANKPIKERMYYLWNLSPNTNQNSSVFLHKLISKLFEDNEALVIERSHQLLVADSYDRTHNAVAGDVFTNVVVEDMEINTPQFRQKDVLFFKLNNQNIRVLLNGLTASYIELISTAKKDYKWNSGRHGTMKVNATPNGDHEWLQAYKTVIEKHVRPYLQSDNGVMPVFNGYEWMEAGTSGNRSQRTTRDIKALADDIYEFTAKAFGAPAALLKGEVEGTRDAVDNLLTFCIDPLVDQLQEEINRKTYGMDGFIAGNYIDIDTSTIKHFDMFDNANSVDKLISSGAFCINDILEAAGRPRISEQWAEQHFITKNYQPIQDLKPLGGSDE